MVSMARWRGKVAVVTGASAGIGAAIVLELVKHGVKVVGLARRVEKVQELEKIAQGSGEIFAFKADVGNEEDIVAAFDFVRQKFGAVHILINNAGITRIGGVSNQDPKYMREVFNVNVFGLSLCTQQAIKLMKEAGVDDGHIIHVNSVLGHVVANHMASFYSSTKFAVTALTETLRQELRSYGSKIRITSLSPGRVKTEFGAAAMAAMGIKNIPKMSEEPELNPEDVAQAAIYILSTPPNVQVHELTIKPIGSSV